MACRSKGASSSGCSIAGRVFMRLLHVERVQPALRGVAPAALCGFPVKAEAAGAEGDHVEEPSGHHQVLVEIDHVGLISRRQMHAKSGAEAKKGQQSSSPSAVETREQR